LDQATGGAEELARQFKFVAFRATERHTSRTCLAPGYDAVLVLKVCGVRRSWLLKRRFGAASVL
jgi:hypothetical protein